MRLRWVLMAIMVLGVLTMCESSKKIQQEEHLSMIEGAFAHWISADKILWNIGDGVASREIRFDREAAITVSNGEVSGGQVISVGEQASLTEQQADTYRHIAQWPVFDVQASPDLVKKALKGQLVAIGYGHDGNVITATRIQTPGVIDELFYYDGHLGPSYVDESVVLTLWAPTAQNVELILYDRKKEIVGSYSADHVVNDTELQEPADGIWSFTGKADEWDKMFYRFKITVYHHQNKKVNTYEVTDPYSVSLSMDSRFSQFVDLYNDESLKPDGWDAIQKSLPHPSDITVYEAHLRDFSIVDKTVPEEHRGTFKAFTYTGKNGKPLSDGMAHLQRLSKAGLSHLHLLPVNDIATVIEDTTRRIDLHHPYARICEFIEEQGLDSHCEWHGDKPIRQVFEELAREDPATEEIQQPFHVPGRMSGLAVYDGFNWGYDPFHFNAPEGSYSTEPDGETRVLEMRQMVKALHESGLKTVIDVVYNHTFASGLSDHSVLDKVVPGYYHRYHPHTGEIETSTCCDNTAAEHAMMEKLIIDSVLLWAKHYKVDSFRFDLMGHHPRYVMEHVKNALAGLSLEEHGVDGPNIYIYGEGWNFGEVADNRMFDQATQFNMGGTGIGNFNDRSRDAIRGGNFSSNGRWQGFVSGLYLFPNEDAGDDRGHQRFHLLEQADMIRVGMAGNLATYHYENRHGDRVDGSQDWIGFAHKPYESVNYIDKHDNETFWDNTQTKLPLHLDMEERVRIHLLGNAFINYGQGVPFFQMGTDILRSKSLDRNSFDSGDWYNAVDFSLKTHNWGTGLPPGWDNETNWDDIRMFLRHDKIEVREEHMKLAHKLFLEQLAIRYSSPLFRLREASDIHKRVTFYNTGPEQEPGIIVMAISDGACAGVDLDPELDGILVLFNADREKRQILLPVEGIEDLELKVHPVQANGADKYIREAKRSGNQFTIPAQSAVVYIAPQKGAQGVFTCNPHDYQ
ncbi:pullulanase-type alpha-1,6-glucosidase [Balneolaceae bacterium ANBcel3]|nr:pullulanase-type alpha-1,6-glucosidase [Balneolaceae bacterium ANBcel3]